MTLVSTVCALHEGGFLLKDLFLETLIVSLLFANKIAHTMQDYIARSHSLSSKVNHHYGHLLHVF